MTVKEIIAKTPINLDLRFVKETNKIRHVVDALEVYHNKIILNTQATEEKIGDVVEIRF